MYPRYLVTHSNDTLKERIQQARALLHSCALCPRRCAIDRTQGKRGYCNTSDKAMVYSVMAHHGEEPPVSGTRGSGTIFFSHCTMRCLYCQNHTFSQQESGREISNLELATYMLTLQEQGCHNINLVTPTHYLAHILEALALAIPKGLHIPLVYNTSGYELPQTIELLNGIIDVYLPDMRYGREKEAIELSDAPGYPQYNQAAVTCMHAQVGIPEFDSQGIIRSGLIIRHLVLPHDAAGTETIMRFIAEQISTDTYISLMSQYTPYYQATAHPQLNRPISEQEYRHAQSIMENCGLANGWIQEAGGLEHFAGIHIKKNV